MSSLRLSSSLNEEAMATAKNQGIVSILCTTTHQTESSPFRRTLSADMSSNKWLIQHGFTPLKKIASSHQLPTNHHEEENTDRFDIWNSIQQDNKKTDQPTLEKSSMLGQFDIWTSIVSQKVLDAGAAPYVHPQVKRSSSSLTEKSLEICTESLGSETGSEGFSSYPPSEAGDVADEKDEQQEKLQITDKVSQVSDDSDIDDDATTKYNYSTSIKKPTPKSFPPPISSLSSRDGPSLHMRSRRDNGRLVLEAVSVQSQNNFHAQRQDGRLILTFVKQQDEEEKPHTHAHVEELEDEFEENIEREVVDETEEEEDDGEEITEETPAPKLSSGILNFHKWTLMMTTKPMVLATRKPTWPKKFNEMVEVDDPITTFTQSLPPRPPLAAGARMISPPLKAASKVTTAAASLNAYEYYWRPKPIISTNNINGDKVVICKGSTKKENEQQKLVVLRGNKGEYLVSSFKGCKEPRRSLLFWDPHCIATS